MTVYRFVEGSCSNTARKLNASEPDRHASSLVFPTIFKAYWQRVYLNQIKSDPTLNYGFDKDEAISGLQIRSFNTV